MSQRAIPVAWEVENERNPIELVIFLSPCIPGLPSLLDKTPKPSIRFSLTPHNAIALAMREL